MLILNMLMPPPHSTADTRLQPDSDMASGAFLSRCGDRK